LPLETPIAKGMSCAANRQAFRVAADFLLGHVDTNIPMLDGEREPAFVRLREETSKENTELMILARKEKLPAAAANSEAENR
jgi:hypothetical protein